MSHSQNLTLTLTARTSGVYFCHATVPGFDRVVSRPAEVLTNARPRISSPSAQTGALGGDIHLDCAAVSVPEPHDMHWRYHGKEIDEGERWTTLGQYFFFFCRVTRSSCKCSLENPHYRIVDSHIQNGRRSTLIIRESVSTDFGTYTCYVENSLGATELEVKLTERRKHYHFTRV